MMRKSWIVFVIFLIMANFSAHARKLNAGPWRFTLKTAHADVPFIIDFKYDNKNLLGTLQNGEESIPLQNIKYKKSSLSIPLAPYEISLELNQEDANTLLGFLVKNNKNPPIKIPIIAIQGHKTRFDARKESASIDLTGKWQIELTDEKDVKSKGVGVFVQKGKDLTGSILTPTGDYRYLSGQVWENKFEAASFDGVYNYLFSGLVNEGKLEALISSNSYTKITGVKDEKAELPDAYKQTELPSLKFIFPDLKGQSVSLNHPKFHNKPVIVQIFGSWCPNCLDEMKFLIPWYKENSKRGIEIIALAFERSLGPDEATVQLKKIQAKMDIPYTILQAGSTAEDKPAEKILGLKNFISFPTTIYLDKNHNVIKVHAGFSGPSTGEFFEKWKTEFNQIVKGLLK